MGNPLRDQELFEKIWALPEDRVAEVEDFVDFLCYREADRHHLTQAAADLSEESLRKVWDNPDDADYDRL